MGVVRQTSWGQSKVAHFMADTVNQREREREKEREREREREREIEDARER
jgi:hypothetical protein